MRRFIFITAAALGALLWAAVALAVEPAARAYGGGGGVIQREVERRGGEGSAALPFTGLDLGLLIGGGFLLLVVGAGLWRLTREKA